MSSVSMRLARRAHPAAVVLPGLLAAITGAAAAEAVDRRWSGSRTLVALGIGFLIGNILGARTVLQGGLRFSARRLIRIGVVLVGFRISASDLLDLGGRGLAVAVAVAGSGLALSRIVGKRLGVSDDVAALIGAGTSICGASAVAAVAAGRAVDENDVAACIALVTLCGSISMLLAPVVGHHFGWSEEFIGSWLGLSIHDVGQVVAAASSVGDVALEHAVVAKLARVALLPPVVVLLSGRAGPAERTPRLARGVPGFVVLFVVVVAVRSSGIVPRSFADAMGDLSSVVLLVAFVGLGAEMKASQLRLVGVRPVGLAVSVSLALSVLAGIAVAWWR